MLWVAEESYHSLSVGHTAHAKAQSGSANCELASAGPGSVSIQVPADHHDITEGLCAEAEQQHAMWSNAHKSQEIRTLSESRLMQPLQIQFWTTFRSWAEDSALCSPGIASGLLLLHSKEVNEQTLRIKTQTLLQNTRASL